MKKIIFTFFLLLYSAFISAQESLTFGIVPQQSASKLAQLWNPIFEEISRKSGIKIDFATAPDIPTFEKRLAAGEYDIAYMNPYHYVVFNKSVGYQALAKARDKSIKGIIVVAKNSEIKTLNDLENSTLAFPAPAAFAASILTQSDLASDQVTFTAKYVSSHDSVYRTVAKGIYPAGGGVVRTFKNVAPEIREQLRILWTTKGYTPHAIAVHPRVKAENSQKIQQVLTTMEEHATGRKLLNNIKIKGFESAEDSDWNDIRALKLTLLSY
ncbi:phosphate/phosphite/phosphonate ABC transporter substrate-binding protein [Psychromonas aquimarina]|uniref:phosphate/phosphite/phosphonate ABC transporter substrate-binding protein n=1 Tax=Psychromonas aquimarina TaxID=444919 RepID=UPI00040595D2|nr:phosphate/phosphite/phosphonate ABC transporter substrate-binding protein [Psychromonas aquimarina]